MARARASRPEYAERRRGLASAEPEPGRPHTGPGQDRPYRGDTERRRTEFLLEAGRLLSASLNTRRCARVAAELATSLLADVAVVILPGVRGPAYWLRSTAGASRVEEGELATAAIAEVPALAGALAGFPPVPIVRLAPACAPGRLMPSGFGPGHVLVAPLPGNGAPAGALLLARGAGGPPFDDETETLVRVFATRAGAAIAAATLYQEQIAINAVLTDELLPPDLPSLDGVELAGSLRASRQAGLIGGDFYDVYRPDLLAGDEPAGWASLVVLGDVCGKGARAAVLAGKIRHSLRTLLLLENRPERLVELVNRSLLSSAAQDSYAQDSYATLVLATVRPGGGHVQVDLFVAGHPEPLILRGDGTVEEITARGAMLGALERVDLVPVTADLAPGELCLLYSDGVTEAPGTCAGMPAAAVVQRLEQITTEWIAHGDQDDRALLAIQAPPAGGRAPIPAQAPSSGHRPRAPHQAIPHATP